MIEGFSILVKFLLLTLRITLGCPHWKFGTAGFSQSTSYHSGCMFVVVCLFSLQESSMDFLTMVLETSVLLIYRQQPFLHVVFPDFEP